MNVDREATGLKMDIAAVRQNRAAITSSLRLRRTEMLRSLKHCLQGTADTKPRTKHHRSPGRGKGSARRSSFKEREWAIVSQTKTGSVSKATLRKLLMDRTESAFMGFPEHAALFSWGSTSRETARLIRDGGRMG